MFKHLSVVEEYLNKYPKLRDNDDKLVANIWHKALCSKDLQPKTITATKFLKIYSEGKLPSASSIKRCRRKLQEEKKELRGKLWELRHQIEKDVIEEVHSLKGA